MPNTALGGRALCPFYKSGSKYTITCEGISKVFTENRDKVLYSAEYCACGNYTACDYYKLLSMKYNEDCSLDIPYLHSIMKRKNIGYEHLAGVIGIDRSTLYRRLQKGIKYISVYDYWVIVTFLELTPYDIGRIFKIQGE